MAMLAVLGVSSEKRIRATLAGRSRGQTAIKQAIQPKFPLEIRHAAHADDVRITLYLFKASSGPATGDIAKVFMNSPKEEDDGEYFYGVLPPPSRP
jgi:hypothetical protein